MPKDELEAQVARVIAVAARHRTRMIDEFEANGTSGPEGRLVAIQLASQLIGGSLAVEYMQAKGVATPDEIQAVVDKYTQIFQVTVLDKLRRTFEQRVAALRGSSTSSKPVMEIEVMRSIAKNGAGL